MNREQHYREAEKRLTASDWQRQEGSMKDAMHEVAMAHVHALLASVAAGPVPGPQVGPIGVRIRGLREDLDLTQTDVSKRMSDAGFANWYQQTVARVEDGKRPLRFDEAMAIAEIFGVPVAELVETGGSA